MTRDFKRREILANNTNKNDDVSYLRSVRQSLVSFSIFPVKKRSAFFRFSSTSFSLSPFLASSSSICLLTGAPFPSCVATSLSTNASFLAYLALFLSLDVGKYARFIAITSGRAFRSPASMLLPFYCRVANYHRSLKTRYMHSSVL